MEEIIKNFLDAKGVEIVWATVKAELVKKIDKSTIQENYLTADEIESAILTALTSYMTSDQVNSAIASAISGIAQFKFETVDAVPTTGNSNTIYLVPKAGSADDVYTEYAFINGKAEPIGTTTIDLSQYWSKSELVPMTAAEIEAILV